MAEGEHGEDGQADKIRVAARHIDHEATERRFAPRAGRIVTHGCEAVMHVVNEVVAFRNHIAGAQRRDVIPGVTGQFDG